MNETTHKSDIIIVNYNGGEKILACLDSLSDLTPSHCKILVVDNASVDGSADLIQNKFPQIQLIRSMKNMGFGAGCNMGVQHTESPFIVFLNPDTQVKQGWLEGLLAPFQDNENLGLTTGKILLMEHPNRINACGNTVHLTGLTFCRGLGAAKTDYPNREEIGAISGAAFAIRRELFEQLGGFDETMFLYMEDTDLSWRVRLLGKTCLYVPDSKIFHHYSLQITPQKIFFLERNRYWMLLKTLKWRTLFFLIPIQILAEVLVWGFIFFQQSEAAADKLRAYRWVISHWRTLIEKRRIFQRLRKVKDRVVLKNTSYKIDFDQVNHHSLGRLSRFIFNPVFYVLHRLSLALIWW